MSDLRGRGCGGKALGAAERPWVRQGDRGSAGKASVGAHLKFAGPQGFVYKFVGPQDEDRLQGGQEGLGGGLLHH